jgi:MFS family permease
MRLLAGAGQAAVVVGFATLALDLAPPARQGEASSYVLVAVHIGIGSGPLLGELLLDVGSFDAVWVVSALGALVCLLAAWLLPSEPKREVIVPTGLFHPAALRPGIVVGLGSLGFLGFLAFLPLYGETIGLMQVAPVFLLSSFTIAVVRTASAKLPDRIGAVRGATLALSFVAVGLLGMGLLGTPRGLYVTTVVMAAGSALLAPSMILAAVQGVPGGERARVIATFTMFMDIAAAVGPSLLGVIASGAGYGATFLLAGGAAGAGLLLLRVWLAPALDTRAAVQSTGT